MLLPVRKELLVISSEVAELLVVAPAETLLSEAKDPVKVVASPIVDLAAQGTVIVPKTSVWLCVSVENAEVSFSVLILTVTKVPPEVGI